MESKKIFIEIVLVVAVVASVYGATQSFRGERISGEGIITATITIENNEVTCTADIQAGSNVFDLMTACNIEFEEDKGFVTSINGIAQDAGANKYWMYYINGEMAQVGAKEYIVQNGDEITWKLESF
ncbi:MAG: DUF4430 domain-containing protein [Candidatus Methanofastidiosia archaeon]|jgi:hypothetical protein